MAIPHLNQSTLPYFQEKIGALRADTPAKWGELDVTRMVRHLRQAVEASLGEVDVPDESTAVLRNVAYVLAFGLMTTWPKGRIKAPDYWTPPAEHDFDRERQLLLEALDRYVQTAAAEPDREGINPLLGSIPLRKWSRVHGIHFNHHFRQFGLV